MNRLPRLVLFCSLLASPLLVQAQELTGTHNVTDAQVAIGGYDVVGYFTQHAALPGQADFSHEHDGVTYYFANAEHQAAFAENPSAYLPKYGGFCAFGIAAANKKFPVDPETFKVVNGELYLFFNDLVQGRQLNSIVNWNAREPQMKATAEKNWAAMQAAH